MDYFVLNLKLMSNDVNAFFPDDVIYRILLWLSVKSLLRFKSVGKSWRALIESSDFTKEHLHYHHHYDHPSLKRENHNLIFHLQADETPITFLVSSVHKFEAPTKYLQLDLPNLHEYFPARVDVAIFNGIVCLHIEKQCNIPKNAICLWNPATKQHRLLPQSPLSLTPQLRNHFHSNVVGFGFDVKTNDYKVIKLIKVRFLEEKHVEVYSLSTGSWRSIETLFPVDYFSDDHPKMPFNNGTCFCWMGLNSQGLQSIFCFDFSSEMFRSISFPYQTIRLPHLNIVSDKIACVFTMRIYDTCAEIWMFNDYGSINEYWAKLYKIDGSYFFFNMSIMDGCFRSIRLSMDGNYFFFGCRQICRFNMVTEEIKYFSVSEFQEKLRECRLPKIHDFCGETIVEFKESLISVGGGNDTPTCVK